MLSSTLRGGGCPAERSQVEANRPVCHPPPTARSPITIIMTPLVLAHIAQLETTDTPVQRAQDSPSLTTNTHLSESRTEQQAYREKGYFCKHVFLCFLGQTWGWWLVTYFNVNFEYFGQWFCGCLLIQFVGLFWFYADLRWWRTLCWFERSGRAHPQPARSSTTNQWFAPIYEFIITNTKTNTNKAELKTQTYLVERYILSLNNTILTK